MEKYYKFSNMDKTYFICPDCETFEKDVGFTTFCNNHSYHMTHFSKSKESIFNKLKRPQIGYNANVVRPKRARLSNTLNNVYKNLTFNVDNLLNIEITEQMKQKVIEEVNRMNTVKIQFGCFITFTNIKEDINETVISLSAKRYGETFFDDVIQELSSKISNYQNMSSGWTIRGISKIFFILTKIEDISYLSGRKYIKSPDSLKQSLSVVNVQNYDNNCFLYAVASVLKYDEIESNRQRPINYEEVIKGFIYDKMPMKLIDIAKFEKQNKLSINVFQYNEVIDEDNIINEIKNPHVDIIFKSKNGNKYPCINLLLLQEEDNYHYIGVTNLNRLLNLKAENKRIRCKWCEKCLHGFRNPDYFDKHIALCNNANEETTLFTMPKEDELEFKSLNKTIPSKFVIYADFESFLQDDEKYAANHTPASAGLLLLGKLILLFKII